MSHTPCECENETPEVQIKILGEELNKARRSIATKVKELEEAKTLLKFYYNQCTFKGATEPLKSKTEKLLKGEKRSGGVYVVNWSEL